MNPEIISFTRHISHTEKGSYLLLPFSVPEGVWRLEIRYDYDRFPSSGSRCDAKNVVDIALRSASGRYVGASGSARDRIVISAFCSTDGYASVPVESGEWHIIAGACQIRPEGVDVRYRIAFWKKEEILLKGDPHTHSLRSDGALSPTRLAVAAQKAGLDFLFLTDHNNPFPFPEPDSHTGVRLLPGMEWTHYAGHAGMLGIFYPCDDPFCFSSGPIREEAFAKLDQARRRGALVVLHHPFCPDCGWLPGFDLPHDLIEVWNGGTSSRVTERTVRWWHRMLCSARRKLPVTGGSDFHSFEGSCAPGSPCLCLYAQSPETPDILSALRLGNSYLSCNPKGPGLHVSSGSSHSVLGRTLPQGSRLDVRFRGLAAEDEIFCITDTERNKIRAKAAPEFNISLLLPDAAFCRFEVRGQPDRNGFAPLKLLSNPVYFLRT